MNRHFLFLILLVFVTKLGAQTIVERHGQLKVDGVSIKDQCGRVAQLKGMSFFWSQWDGKEHWNTNTIQWLKDDWKVEVTRAAVAVRSGDCCDYLGDSTGTVNQLRRVIDGSIQHGTYVIIDWHAHGNHVTKAKNFFKKMAQLYGDKPNVIYEIWNEPEGSASDPGSKWAEIKTYSKEVIAAIRAIDPDNIIIVPTPFYDQFVNTAADDPLTTDVNGNPITNVAYALHVYTDSHRFDGNVGNNAKYAVSKGLPMWVTESGATGTDFSQPRSTGRNTPNYDSYMPWVQFFDINGISYNKWSLSTKDEFGSALLTSAPTTGGWNVNSHLTDEGRWNRNHYREVNTMPNSCAIDTLPKDTLFSLIGPASLNIAGSATYKATYSATTDRDLIVTLESTNGTIYSTTTIDLSSGILKESTFSITLPNNVPAGNDAYIIKAIITPNGGSNANKFDSKSINNVDVIAVDKVNSITLAGKVTRGLVMSTTVNYTASIDRDIVVYFQKDNGSGTTYGSARATVAAGSSQSVILSVPTGATTPIEVDGYQFKAFIVPVGADTTGSLGSYALKDIDVIPADKIYSITAPDSIAKGSSPSITIKYSASVARDIIALFQLDSDNFTIYGQTKVDVVSGDSQTVNITIPTNTNTPTGIDAYQFKGILTTDGGTGANGIDSLAKVNVDVTNTVLLTDVISSIAAPNSVIQGGTASVTVNYSATTNRDVIVIFQLDNGAYTQYGSTKLDVVAGQNQTATINVFTGSTTAVANDNYQFQVLIAPDGGNWNNRFSNIAKTDIDITAFALNNNATYRIKSANANVYLNSTGSSSGSNVNVANLNNNATSQRWTIENVSGSVYRLNNNNGSKYLNAQGSTNGSNVGVANLSNSADAQKWTLEQSSGNTYRLKCSLGAKYLNAQGTSNSSNVGVANSNTSANAQKWIFELVSTSTPLLAPSSNINLSKSMVRLVAYPNPTNGSDLNINVTNLSSLSKTAHLSITSIMGAKILDQEVSNNTMYTFYNNIFPSKGMYIITLNDNDNIQTLKVLIQ
jgi:hypothetical protein